MQVVQYAEMDQEERVDPMIYVFPRMTKCHFHKFGPSGTLERHDAFCLLPLNILNEKVSWRPCWYVKMYVWGHTNRLGEEQKGVKENYWSWVERELADWAEHGIVQRLDMWREWKMNIR